MSDFADIIIDHALKTVYVKGDGDIHQLMNLKTASALATYQIQCGPKRIYLFDIINRMTPSTRDSFNRLLKTDKKLAEEYKAAMPNRFLKENEVIEELVIGLNPIGVIIFTKSGERLIARSTEDYNSLLTFDEFEQKYKRTVIEWIRHDANSQIEAIKRAITLLEGEPIEYTLSVMNAAMAMDTVKVIAYSKEQTKIYAARQKVSIMDSKAANESPT